MLSVVMYGGLALLVIAVFAWAWRRSARYRATSAQREAEALARVQAGQDPFSAPKDGSSEGTGETMFAGLPSHVVPPGRIDVADVSEVVDIDELLAGESMAVATRARARLEEPTNIILESDTLPPRPSPAAMAAAGKPAHVAESWAARAGAHAQAKGAASGGEVFASQAVVNQALAKQAAATEVAERLAAQSAAAKQTAAKEAAAKEAAAKEAAAREAAAREAAEREAAAKEAAAREAAARELAAREAAAKEAAARAAAAREAAAREAAAREIAARQAAAREEAAAREAAARAAAAAAAKEAAAKEAAAREAAAKETAARQAAERQAAERLAAARQAREAERIEAQQRAAEQAERMEAARKDAERKEAERKLAEQRLAEQRRAEQQLAAKRQAEEEAEQARRDAQRAAAQKAEARAEREAQALAAAAKPKTPAKQAAQESPDRALPLRELALAWFEARGYRGSPASAAVRPIELVLRHKDDPARAYAFVVEHERVNAERVHELRAQAKSIGLVRVLIVADAGADADALEVMSRKGVRLMDRAALDREFSDLDFSIAAKIIAVARKRAAFNRGVAPHSAGAAA